MPPRCESLRANKKPLRSFHRRCLQEFELPLARMPSKIKCCRCTRTLEKKSTKQNNGPIQRDTFCGSAHVQKPSPRNCLRGCVPSSTAQRNYRIGKKLQRIRTYTNNQSPRPKLDQRSKLHLNTSWKQLLDRTPRGSARTRAKKNPEARARATTSQSNHNFPLGQNQDTLSSNAQAAARKAPHPA